MDRRIRVTARKDRSVHDIQYSVANPPKTSLDLAREACVAKGLGFSCFASPRRPSGDLPRRSIAVEMGGRTVER